MMENDRRVQHTALELFISLENILRSIQGEYTASIEATLIEYGIYDDIWGDMARE